MNSNINMKKIYILMIFFLFILSLTALKLGSIEISVPDIVNTVISSIDIFNIVPDGGKVTDASVRTIILNVRLPRIIMAILVGMLLASSGTVVQTVFPNPLADPYIIGISASATLGAVIAFMLNMPDVMYGVLGFVTSVAASLIIFRLSKAKKGTDITTLLIVGIAV